MKVVLDTNVLVAALLNPRGTPSDILNLILNVEVILFYDDRIIGEYRSVLKRDKFNLDHDDVDTVVNYLEEIGLRVDARPLDVMTGDPDDVMFYEVLESSRADYLITGNTKHFAGIRDKRIVTPAEFMKRYFK
jgi:uncharacterized protein